MKRPCLLVLFLILVGASVCKSDAPGPNPATLLTMSTKLHIRIGADTFTATLLDNPTTTAFVALLPLTISMTELNSNEKYHDLPASLPTNAVSPGSIQAGDLLLYGANTLVLFYQPLSTSYRYTRMGRVDSPAGLSAALGRGSATVKFEVQ
ncbi:cyclophilin-like fold protein [Hymenobacter yonginensis]|uniref:Cyclophilin-like fold protein n=1 Tax=Hymenobacter yonginensis TaxID=748197 RepID=A0ABY7PWJ3_9BACT|nr:cyclophilin-like fold protein [Hymenobacter yonginensis]WBO86869.1 cyclophilin-like fold protein [Hymenobacter yonginensis]